MKQWFEYLLAGLIFCVLLSFSSPIAAAECKLDRGGWFSSAGEIAKVIDTCTQNIVKNSNDIDSLFWRGLAYYQTGYRVDGSAPNRSGIFKSALADFDKVLALQPNDVQALENRAATQYQLGNYSGAIKDATAAISIDSKSISAFMSRGRARYELKQYTGSIEDFSQVFELEPDAFAKSTALVYQADAYAGNGAYAYARGNLLVFLLDYPDVVNWAVYEKFALLSLAMGEKNMAVSAYSWYIEKVQGDPKIANDPVHKKYVEKAKYEIANLMK